MYVIKNFPQDFIVKELSTIVPKEQGRFLYFTIQKTNLTTHAAIAILSAKFKVPEKNFSYAGLKDKHASTEQVCSVFGIPKSKLEFSSENISTSYLGAGDEPVHLGDLSGNEFQITVRNIEKIPKINETFKNYFGEQRLSSQNADVGKLLVKGDFAQAADLLGIPAGKDALARIKTVPRKTLILYVHAYQSLLWNRAAAISSEDSLPIVGFGTEDIDECTKKVLKDEGISPRDFIIRKFPELSSEGAERKVWSEAQNISIKGPFPDECFEGKSKFILSFFLEKGSYATEFIRQNFTQDLAVPL